MFTRINLMIEEFILIYLVECKHKSKLSTIYIVLHLKLHNLIFLASMQGHLDSNEFNSNKQIFDLLNNLNLAVSEASVQE